MLWYRTLIFGQQVCCLLIMTILWSDTTCCHTIAYLVVHRHVISIHTHTCAHAHTQYTHTVHTHTHAHTHTHESGEGSDVCLLYYYYIFAAASTHMCLCVLFHMQISWMRDYYKTNNLKTTTAEIGNGGRTVTCFTVFCLACFSTETWKYSFL